MERLMEIHLLYDDAVITVPKENIQPKYNNAGLDDLIVFGSAESGLFYIPKRNILFFGPAGSKKKHGQYPYAIKAYGMDANNTKE